MRARAGNLLVFWTRTPDGIDPCSFHSGEAVAHHAPHEKWLLRKFKEVPPRVFDDPDALREFVAASRRPWAFQA